MAPAGVLTLSFGAVYFSAPGTVTRKMRPRVRSPIAWPPTPGSYQSATISEPSGATQTSAGRNHLSRAPVSTGAMVAV